MVVKVQSHRQKARIGITAPDCCSIHRAEIQAVIDAELGVQA